MAGRMRSSRSWSAAEPAKAYVDKHVAHLDRVESPATYADLHVALDVIVDALLTVKFALAGSGPTTESFNKAAEQFDWARVFRTAWITDTTWPKVMDTRDAPSPERSSHLRVGR